MLGDVDAFVGADGSSMTDIPNLHVVKINRLAAASFA